MVAATQPVAAPKSRLLRFWSDTREPYTDGHIRIEWVGADGVTRTSAGRYYIDDNCVVWDYEEPPNRVYNDAIECAGSAGEFTVVSIDRAVIEFAGRETYAQMCEVVECAHQDADLVINPEPTRLDDLLERHLEECRAPGGSF